jgi:hypothetical protein
MAGLPFSLAPFGVSTWTDMARHRLELALPDQPDIPVRVNPYFKKNRTFKMRPLRRLVPA